MVSYAHSVEAVIPNELQGFFVGWTDPPSPETQLTILHQSSHVVLARIDEGRVVGFITAITDGVLNAHITLLEVLPEFRRQGIGAELMRKMLAQLSGFYAVDLICDPASRSFYQRFGFREATGMMIRRTNP